MRLQQTMMLLLVQQLRRQQLSLVLASLGCDALLTTNEGCQRGSMLRELPDDS
jgi:hypothetical protein